MNVSWSSEKRSLWIIVSKEVFKENFERQVACLQITAFLHSFSLRTISLYQLSLSPQFPFSLHFTASSILSPFEKSVGIPDGQIQCFQSLVHYNIFRIILSFLDFMPPLVSGQQYTCEVSPFLGSSYFPLHIDVSQGPELSPPLFLQSLSFLSDIYLKIPSIYLLTTPKLLSQALNPQFHSIDEHVSQSILSHFK